MIKIAVFIKQHHDGFLSAVVGGGSLSALFSNIEIGLKILVAAATLVYFIIKIRKELKK